MVSVSLHTRTLQSKFAGNWERKILLRHSSNREMSVWLRRKKNFHIEILFTWDRTLTCGTRDKYVIITSSKLHIYLFLPLFLDVSLPPTIPSVFTTQPLMFSDPTPTSDPYPLVPNSSKNIFNVVCEEKDDDFKKQKHKTWLTYKFLWHLRVLPPTPPSHKPGRSPTCIIYFILDWEEELDNATLLLLSLLPNHTSAPTVPPPKKTPCHHSELMWCFFYYILDVTYLTGTKSLLSSLSDFFRPQLLLLLLLAVAATVPDSVAALGLHLSSSCQQIAFPA